MAGKPQIDGQTGACPASWHKLPPLCQRVPEVGGRCPLQCQAGQVDSGINQEEEGGHDPRNGVELPREKHQLQRAWGGGGDVTGSIHFLGWYPGHMPKPSLPSLGHATAACQERVWVVPHGEKSLPLAVIYPSFMDSGREGHSCSRTLGTGGLGGIPRGRDTCQAPRRPAQVTTHLHLARPGKEHRQQTHLHHQPGEDHRHHWVPAGRCLLGQRQRPACRQSGEVELGHPSRHQQAQPPARSPVPSLGGGLAQVTQMGTRQPTKHHPHTTEGVPCCQGWSLPGTTCRVSSGGYQCAPGTHQKDHPGPEHTGCGMPQ